MIGRNNAAAARNNSTAAAGSQPEFEVNWWKVAGWIVGLVSVVGGIWLWMDWCKRDSAKYRS